MFETPYLFTEELSESVKDFDCGDTDLNEFLKEDALRYSKVNLATTYLCSHKGYGLLAYFSLSADSIEINEKEKEVFREYDKALREYPAIKIGRLAVQKEFRNHGIGEKIIDLVVGYARSTSRQLAVRYVSVDAYPEVVDFYKKCGFTRFKLKGSNTAMYKDILIKK